MATGLYPRMCHASRRQFTVLPGTFHMSVTRNASFTSFRRSRSRSDTPNSSLSSFWRSGSRSDMPNSSLSSLWRSRFVTKLAHLNHLREQLVLECDSLRETKALTLARLESAHVCNAPMGGVQPDVGEGVRLLGKSTGSYGEPETTRGFH